MDKKSGIYTVTNKNNGKVYVGNSVDIYTRWSQHKSSRSCCVLLKKALKKYGVDGFSWNILEVVDVNGLEKPNARKVLLEAEQKWLDTICPFGDRGYNILKKAGSALGAKRSDATKEALSRAFKGKKHPEWRVEKNRQAQIGLKRSPESSEKKRLAMIGRTSPMKGRKHSEEAKAKIRSGGTGKHLGTFSETHRENLSKSLSGRESSFKGKHHSEEAKAKLRAAKLGKPSPRKGVTLSEETKEKIRAKVTGFKHSPEARAKIRAAALRQWQKQKS